MIKNSNIFLKTQALKVAFLAVVFIVLIIALPYSYSRYESVGDANVVSTVAYYVLDVNRITDNIRIDSLAPSDDPYVYEFSISNHDGTNRLETRLEYDLIIRTTTNLPLEFELYLNEDYTNPAATNIISSDNFIQDEDGMYIRELKVPKAYFNYLYNETNEYTLLVFFSRAYISYEYQNIIENMVIEIDSRQIISEQLAVTDNLVLHLDAAKITGLADYDTVEVWEDLSGLENNAVQGTSGNRPVYRINQMNGLPVVKYDGTTHLSIADDQSLRINPEITIFVVINLENRTTGTGNITTITSKETVHNNRNWWLVQWDGKWQFRQSGMGTSTVESDDDAATSPTLLTIIGDGSSMRMFVDGVEQQSNVNYSNLDTQNSSVGVGRQADTTNRNWQGDIAEIIIYDTALSENNQQMVEQYLGAKWLAWSN